MEAAILETLKSREGLFVSGEELSRLCGVSRAAIWKEVEKLRAEGYKIIGEPHAGYRLVSSPDRLTSDELSFRLDTKRIGTRIYAYEETSSTMDVALQLASHGEGEGAVVVAESQTKGRGRLGRQWNSPKGKGIYLSVILRPAVSLREVPLITLMAAVACAQALEETTGQRPQIKWPNDLLYEGKKIAGILTELNAELNRVHSVILGIGMNVNTEKRHLPAGGTSLFEEMGEKFSRVKLARSLLKALDHIYDSCLSGGFTSMLEEWRRCAAFLGRRVRVAAEGRTVDGMALDVDPQGSLLVRTDTGIVESVSAGEVLLLR